MRKLIVLTSFLLTACQGPGLQTPLLKTREVFEANIAPYLEVETTMQANRPTDAFLNLGGGISKIRVLRGDQALNVHQEWMGPVLVTVRFTDHPEAGPVSYRFEGLDGNGRIVAAQEASTSVTWTVRGPAPSIVSPANEGEVGTDAAVTWTAVEGATGYVVRMTRPGSTFVDLAVVPPSKTTHRYLSPLARDRHLVQVSAYWADPATFDALRLTEARSATHSFMVR